MYHLSSSIIIVKFFRTLQYLQKKKKKKGGISFYKIHKVSVKLFESFSLLLFYFFEIITRDLPSPFSVIIHISLKNLSRRVRKSRVKWILCTYFMTLDFTKCRWKEMGVGKEKKMVMGEKDRGSFVEENRASIFRHAQSRRNYFHFSFHSFSFSLFFS